MDTFTFKNKKIKCANLYDYAVCNLQGEIVGVVWKHYHKKGELSEGQAEIRFYDSLKTKYGTWRRIFINGVRLMYDKLEKEIIENGETTKTIDSQRGK